MLVQGHLPEDPRYQEWSSLLTRAERKDARPLRLGPFRRAISGRAWS